MEQERKEPSHKTSPPHAVLSAFPTRSPIAPLSLVQNGDYFALFLPLARGFRVGGRWEEGPRCRFSVPSVVFGFGEEGNTGEFAFEKETSWVRNKCYWTRVFFCFRLWACRRGSYSSFFSLCCWRVILSVEEEKEEVLCEGRPSCLENTCYCFFSTFHVFIFKVWRFPRIWIWTSRGPFISEITAIHGASDKIHWGFRFVTLIKIFASLSDEGWNPWTLSP